MVALGGPVEKMWFFQIAPTPYLSILICSKIGMNMISWKFLLACVIVNYIHIIYYFWGTATLPMYKWKVHMWC